MKHESIEFDVVIVGAGPSGLAAGIRLAQLSATAKKPLNICIIDKGVEVGAHILSGAVLDPKALNELLPDWKNHQPPTYTPVTQDRFLFLTERTSWRFPTPPPLRNQGNYIISLGQFCRWLAKQAEQLGINIFPGFAAIDVLYDNDRVCGILTGDKGVDKHGQPKSNYQPGIALHAKQIILAEGCRGSLTERLIQQYHLRQHASPQTYGLGIKELWEIPAEYHQSGQVIHSVGWPLDHQTYGGSFAYHLDPQLLSIGFVVGLDYRNPYLNPYEVFQQLKTHPVFHSLLKKSRRIAYGARTLVEGGIQSIPTLDFPGGLIIGDAAGFLNVAKIKGIHNAMKSGMIAAESLYTLLGQPIPPLGTNYTKQLKSSWVWKELHRVRNIRAAFKWGLWPGLAYAALDTYIFRGYAPWTFKYHLSDHTSLKKANQYTPIAYPKHDNQVSFDITSSIYLSRIHYVENQPYHLKLKDKYTTPIAINLNEYAGPETRYCPAGVYEFFYNEKNEPRLMINGGNCIHCKACDIKDPTQNITWTPSEGGSGPDYERM